MIRLNRKTLLPLCALFLTSGGLLAVWWLGSDSAPGPADNRRNPTVAPDAGSARVLKELTVLRDASNLRDLTRDAGELIGRDQTLSAEELKALGEDLFGAGYPGTAELCFRTALAQAKSDESATLNLARLLYTTGRVEEARSYLTGLLRTGKFDLECLPMLGDSELVPYPLPDWHQLRSRISSDGQDATTSLVFSDDARTSGIQFQYQDAAIANSDTTRLFEFTGGGVAALDVDPDGWPDVFFTRGGNAPALGNPSVSSASASEASPTDQLFRNLRGQLSSIVTESAKLIDGGYSQGCASGDFDMDGFPDLYDDKRRTAWTADCWRRIPGVQ